MLLCFVACNFHTVQKEVSDIIKNRILVGHAIRNDLQVCRVWFHSEFRPMWQEDLIVRSSWVLCLAIKIYLMIGMIIGVALKVIHDSIT